MIREKWENCQKIQEGKNGDNERRSKFSLGTCDSIRERIFSRKYLMKMIRMIRRRRIVMMLLSLKMQRMYIMNQVKDGGRIRA